MNTFWKTVLIAAVCGAVYGILSAVLNDIFGTDVINQFWDSFIVVVIVFIAIAVSNKQSSPPE